MQIILKFETTDQFDIVYINFMLSTGLPSSINLQNISQPGTAQKVREMKLDFHEDSNRNLRLPATLTDMI